MRLLVVGINPEPWTSPSLGTKRAGGRIVPTSFKDENLRSYQMAVHELVEEALAEQGIMTPVYGKGVELGARFSFWRQLDRYHVSEGRTRVRQQPDLTNLVKAFEDALQGLLYVNDRAIRESVGCLVDVGQDLEPAAMVEVHPLPAYRLQMADIARTQLTRRGTKARSSAVYLEGESWESPSESVGS